MARLQWVVLCERAIVEDQAKTISLISILENIQLPSPPPQLLQNDQNVVLPLRFFVVHQWTRSNPKIGERIATRVLLRDPTGKQYGSQEALVDLTDSIRGRVIGQVVGVPFRGEGVYKCVVQAKVRAAWRTAGTSEFGLIYQTSALRKH
jgi:hypothetical protein